MEERPKWEKGTLQRVTILCFKLGWLTWYLMCCTHRCGLRYARSRAKKEGPLSAPSRKRKEKGNVKRESATPPSSYSTTSTPTAARRTFASSNVGSSEFYGAAPHPQHHLLDNHFTPSPSPPAVTGVAFGHYGTASGHGPSHDNNNRHSPYSHPSNSFYSTPIPSPLSIIHTPQQQNQPSSQPTPSSSVNHQRHLLQQHPRSQQHLHSHAQLPPLDQIKTAIPSSMPPSSYSHDREGRGQQHQSHQQQSQQLTPLSTGDAREGYRRSIWIDNTVAVIGPDGFEQSKFWKSVAFNAVEFRSIQHVRWFIISFRAFISWLILLKEKATTTVVFNFKAAGL